LPALTTADAALMAPMVAACLMQSVKWDKGAIGRWLGINRADGATNVSSDGAGDQRADR